MLSSKKKLVLVAAPIAAVVAILSMCRTLSGPEPQEPPERAWKCTRCDHVFEEPFERPGQPERPRNEGLWAIPAVPDKDEPSGQPALETAVCPECGGEAHRYITLRCTKCGKVFQHLEDYASQDERPASGRAPRRELKQPVCPECGSTGVVPR